MGNVAVAVAGLALLALLGAAVPAALGAQELKTIRPGMTEAEVRIAWGDPFTVKHAGVMSYLYYRNDCLKRCGTYDVVFLEKGQVIDAVVRDSHHRYDGIASSPVDRKPGMTKP
jgi:hypothetical protein